MTLDVARIRQDFPILQVPARGRPLVYLDNAATSQKPRQVIDAITRYYESQNGNIHRGVHYLSETASELYEGARERTRKFLNARRAHEVIFTRGTTESVNLVAHGFGAALLKPGDEIVTSTMEHHSNLVPWQQACLRSGARLVATPVTDAGELDLEAYEALLTERTRLVALTWVSNAMGTINDVRRIIAAAHARGIPVFLDGAQAAPHLRVDLQAIDCDFLACSGHKMLGPTGVGVLYGKEAWLEKLPPYQTGGGMIELVNLESSTWARLPARFEAGTPDIAAVVGFTATLDYLDAVGMDAIAAHEHALVTLASERLQAVPGLRIIGTTPNKAGVLSFVMEGAHPHDIGTILDQEGVAVRAGHHCCQPLMRRFGVPSTARASFYLYNTADEVDRLVAACHTVRHLFA